MIYAVLAHFRPGAEAELAKLHAAFNDRLSQREPRVRLAGPLRDLDGRRAGALFLVEGPAEAVRTFVAEPPLDDGRALARLEFFQFDLEVGSLS